MEIGPKFVRVSCFGYSLNIPIEDDYKSFLFMFRKKFEVTESETKNIYFNLYFCRGSIYVPFELKNQKNYYEAFTSKENMRMQFEEITGKANFPGSDIEKKKKKR